MIQDTTIQRIRTRHVSEYGLEGSPEQETDIPEAKPSANDKWAQSTTHQDKGEGRWPHWVAGRPPWSANGPVGPTASNLPCGGSTLDVEGGSERLNCRMDSPWPFLPPINTKGGGRNETHNTPNSTHLSPLDLEAFIQDA